MFVNIAGSVAANLDTSPPIEKQERLFERFRSVHSVIVAFSGGTDSAYLAWAAHHVLGPNALSITAVSASFSEHDREQAGAFAREQGLHHEWIETHEFENPRYLANEPDRCYHCKVELFSTLAKLKESRGIHVIAYGVNVDDLRDFRPGHRAAAECGIETPLLDAGLTKAEIRILSRRAGLSTWDRPAAACLSSRVPYGTVVTVDVLSRVERAESVLRDFGFRQVRVRSHGHLARVEIEKGELPCALEEKMSRELSERIRSVGFEQVVFDPGGYRQGALNESLRQDQRKKRS